MKPVTSEDICKLIVHCFHTEGKVLTFGVGGNAANAIHFAAELQGKFEKYDTPLPCIDLVSNPSIISAIATDFGWEHVFERQIRGLAQPGDVVVAFSISTKGQYLLNAIRGALASGCSVALICGKYTDMQLPDYLERLNEFEVLELDSLDTPWVQEKQLELIHKICREVKGQFQVK